MHGYGRAGNLTSWEAISRGLRRLMEFVEMQALARHGQLWNRASTCSNWQSGSPVSLECLWLSWMASLASWTSLQESSLVSKYDAVLPKIMQFGICQDVGLQHCRKPCDVMLL